jgi:Tfp pilus assembly protein PilF
VKLVTWILTLIFCVPAARPISAQEMEGSNFAVAVAELKNGVNVGFALVRSRSSKSGVTIGEAVFPRSSGVTRVLYDRKGGSYFGYRLDVDAVRNRQYRFEFKSLPGNIDEELVRHMKCPECPHPTPLEGSLIRFPGPLTLSEGAICTIDLLINPQTGEKIVDVIMASPKSISQQTMQAAAHTMREAIALVERGDAQVARGNNRNAIDEYKKALAINPNDSSLWNKLGIVYQRTSQVDLAQSQFERAIKLNSKFAEAWNNLGSCYHMKGKYKQAIRYYQEAIGAKPSFAAAYKNMGSAYFAMKRFEDGFQAFQAAFRLDPAILETSTSAGVKVSNANAGELFFYLAKLSAASKQNDAALDFLAKAFEGGFKDCSRIARDSDLRPLANVPRFQQIVQPVCPQR